MAGSKSTGSNRASRRVEISTPSLAANSERNAASIRSSQTIDAAASEDGIVVRTNFATTADGDRGTERFARARALLHLNTIPERFGLVLAESNAAGVPVIAMDLGSCCEVIDDGRTGFLVNNVNDEELRASLAVGEQVKLSGFGNFDLRDKKERPGRNPKTGQEIPISARRVVTFRPGQKLKARVEAYAGTGE